MPVVPAEREPEVLARDATAVHRAEVEHGHTAGEAPADDTDGRRQHDRRHDATDEPELSCGDVTRRDGRRDGAVDDKADGGGREARHHAVDDAAEHGEGEPARLALDAPPDDGQTLPQGRGGRDVHCAPLPW
jgi:hypothetical protein